MQTPRVEKDGLKKEIAGPATTACCALSQRPSRCPIFPLVTAANFCTLVVVAAGDIQQIAIERRAKVQEFQRKHRIGLLTLVFTDVVDSTRLKQVLGDRKAVSALQQHHAAIREILGQFSEGEEIETAGDSFFLVFTKPSDAVPRSSVPNCVVAMLPSSRRQFTVMVNSNFRFFLHSPAKHCVATTVNRPQGFCRSRFN